MDSLYIADLSLSGVALDGDADQRTVWPLGLFFRGETRTLGAWCELRGEYRSFRLDRMLNLVALDSHFQGGGLLEDYIRVVSGTTAS